MLGFYTGASIDFSSPAVSVSYAATGAEDDDSGAYEVGVLTVTESDNAVISIAMDGYSTIFSGNFAPNYVEANFTIVNGAVVYTTVVPPVAPVITGTAAGQAEREGASERPFGIVTVTDGNANASDTATVQLSAVNGTLTDPNAAADGSSYNASTGLYTVRGTAQAITQDLDALVFTPNFYTLGQSGSFTTGFTLKVTSSAGASATDATTTIITYAPLTADNFSGTGMSGIVMQNVDGAGVIYTTNGLGVTAATSIGDPGPTWHIMGSADFNGDGQPDLLLQNDNGALVDYVMKGTGVTAAYSLGNPGSSWHVRGLGDFNADGDADILLQNDNGALVILETNGTSLIGSASLGSLPAGWAVEGVADFYGNGHPDILVQSSTGVLVLYTMSGTSITAGAVIGNPGAGWSVAGTGDYNGDGKADILLHNDNGANMVWAMNGPTETAAVSLGNPGAGYTTAVAGLDLDGDGHADLVVQNAATSTLVGYTVNGSAAITAGAVLGTPGAGWDVVGSNPITFIDGTGSNLALAGTPGPDQFNLTSYAAGIHMISSFDPAQDTLALSVAAFPSYAAVQANEAPYQGGTFINLSPTAAIVIQGVTPGQLSSGNFVLR